MPSSYRAILRMLAAACVLAWSAGGLNAASSAIRTGDWKMPVSGGTTTLYNIATIPVENTNLAASQPANLAPFFGATCTLLDAGLKRQAISAAQREFFRFQIDQP